MQMMKKAAAVMAAAVMLGTALPVSAAEQKITTGIPYGDLQSKIEAYAAENPDYYVSFGAGVVTADDILYTGTFGYADRESGIKADEETVYEWGSITKTLVWVSVMQLWEQGKIDFNADVSSYLPENFFQKRTYSTPVTMLNLMNHSGGWGENTWAFQTNQKEKIVSLEESLRVTEPAQIYEPGTLSSYSNWGAALAGFIVERVSGESFSDYVHAHIFEPLGMEHTAVAADRSDNPWVQEARKKVMCYAPVSPTTWFPSGTQDNYIILYPCGAAVSTVGDMAKYAQALVQKPSPLFEKESTYEEMLSASSTYGDSGIPMIAHGLLPELNGDIITYGHNGMTNGSTANLRFDPENGLAVFVLTNGARAMRLIQEIPEIAFGERTVGLPESYQPEITSHEDISGLYFNVRSLWHGPMKVISLLNILPLTKQSEDTFAALGVLTMERISDDIFLLKQGGIEANALCAKNPDGTMSVDLGAQSYKTSSNLTVSLLALGAFLLFTAIGFILLIVKLVQRLIQKRKKYVGAGWMTAAQFARFVSIGAFFFLMVVFSPQFGITKMQGYVTCGIQAVCLLIFSAAALSSLRGMFTKNPEKASGFKYFVNFVANSISAFAIVVLELVRFWGV